MNYGNENNKMNLKIIYYDKMVIRLLKKIPNGSCEARSAVNMHI